MAPKAIFFIVAAFLTLLALADTSATKKATFKESINGAFDGLIEILEQVILEMNKLINEAIYEVAYGIRTIFEALEELSDFGKQLAEDIIGEELSGLDALVKAVKNRTDAEGLDISDCIAAEQNEAVELRDQAANYSVDCIDSAIKAVEDGTMQVMLDIRTLNEQVRKEEKNMENCKNETAPLSCLQDVFNNVMQIAVNLTTTIESDADKAQAEYDNLGSVINECVTKTSALVQDDFDKVFNDFSQCVNDKEHGSTPAY